MKSISKQPTLKPQDLLVALKLSVSPEHTNYASLAEQLAISLSEVHAAVQRATASHLITRDNSGISANRSSLREFLVHGLKYVFPIVLGPLTRGLPTGVSAPPLYEQFQHSDALPLVWPDQDGLIRGISVLPIYPSVPSASKKDAKLYRLLAVVDALRGGAAREREMAKECLESVIR